MEHYESTTGGRLLAIPHNSNLYNGLMFDDITLTTMKPIDKAYAERRKRFEPDYEVTQIKGDSEAHPHLSPIDEFADYGTWDKGSFGPERKTPEMLPREYAREAIWDAFMRKEVYATTGTRMLVRVSAGWEFETNDLNRSDFARHGYEVGVPMGGDLSDAPRGKSPTLLVRALRDPDGANLDRVQVIKGWVNADGKTQEQVYDVAYSGRRRIVRAKCKGTVGNTVDVAKATYDNSIGEPFLQTAWQDPDFDPALRAFYYIRVLEIPTPRWTTYDAAHFGVDLPDGIASTHQERAYTSPIWYTP